MGAHSHAASGAASKLKLGIIVTTVVLAVELAGGIMSNSLALMSDAGHVLADVIALGLSWYGIRQAERPASGRMTFGYHRVGVIVAIVNAISILAIAAVILFEAYERLQQQPEVNSTMMLVVALIGLAANIFVALRLHGEQEGNLNVRSAFWHAAGDALASVGVIAGAVIIMLTGLTWVDAAVSILISLVIVFAAWGIFREGLAILLEAVPGDIRVKEVVSVLSSVEGVKDVHDIHIWSLSSGLHAMSCHIVVDDCPVSQVQGIQRQIEVAVRDRFSIGHCNVQAESGECGAGELFCNIEANGGVQGHHH